MEIKDLITLLNNQKANLRKLHDAAAMKQQALVSSSSEELENSIAEEEKALLLIQQSEKARIGFLSAFYKKYGIANDTFRLSECLEKMREHIDRESAELISGYEKEIRAVINEVSRVNQQNKYLIEHSRAFIRETISTLMNSGNSILDRKI